MQVPPGDSLRPEVGQLGRIDEAKEALEKAIALAPAAFDMYVRGRVPWMRSKTTPTCWRGCVRLDGKVEPGAAARRHLQLGPEAFMPEVSEPSLLLTLRWRGESGANSSRNS